MEIKTERLTLVSLGLVHLKDYNSYASDPELSRLMAFLPMDDINMSRRFLTACEQEWACEKPRAWEFAIMLNDKNIGEISIYDENGEAELGWIISREYQRHGYACEAARALIEFGEKHLGFNTFIAHCDSENAASYGLMEKLGMKRVGESYDRKNKLSDELRTEYTYKLTL